MWVVCSVYDRKAREFGQLLIARSNEVAARMFADAVLGPQESILRLHPEDFVLVLVGEFDEVAGDLYGCGHVNVAEAEAVVYRPITGGESAS